MPIKLDVAQEINAIDLNFNQVLGIQPLKIDNKFIGINTRDQAFQNLFGEFNSLFKGGYTRAFSTSFSKGPVSIEAAADLILGRVYANVGVNVSAGYDLGGVKVGLKTSGAVDLSGSVPDPTGGIVFSGKTLADFGGIPNASLTLPTASLKAGVLADVDITPAAIDGRVSARWKKWGVGVDLPRFGLGGFKGTINKKGKNGKPVPLNVIDYSLQSVLDGKARNLLNPKQKQEKGLFETEWKGVRFSSNLRSISRNLKTTSLGTKTAPSVNLSGEIPIITVDTALARLVSNIDPKFKLLSQRFTGNGYDVDYKLVDFSVGSNLKLRYNGAIQLTGRYSRATLESGDTMNLNGQINGLSNLTGISSTSQLKRILDANGDGKAEITFDWGYNNSALTLDYGLFANVFGFLEAGKLKADVGAEFSIGGRLLKKDISFKRTLVNTTLYKKKDYTLTQDLKILGGNKTVPLNASPYRFSSRKFFNMPANADDLIGLLGIDPAAILNVNGTDRDDTLRSRTEQGNDIFRGGAGNDTMIGGLGDDIYIVDSPADIVEENDSSGADTIYSTAAYYGLSNSSSVEKLIIISGQVFSDGRALGQGNDFNNVILSGADILPVSLYGKGGDDILTGSKLDDYLAGGDGNDTLEGRDGNDLLVDSDGRNTLLGGSGDDSLTGSLEGGVLVGETGADVFELYEYNREANDRNYALPGQASKFNYVRDFQVGVDKLKIIDRGVRIIDFRVGYIPDSTSPIVIYFPETGELNYYREGTSSPYARTIALLENKPASLSSSDFLFSVRGRQYIAEQITTPY